MSGAFETIPDCGCAEPYRCGVTLSLVSVCFIPCVKTLWNDTARELGWFKNG
jgi:hypothetical protein